MGSFFHVEMLLCEKVHVCIWLWQHMWNCPYLELSICEIIECGMVKWGLVKCCIDVASSNLFKHSPGHSSYLLSLSSYFSLSLFLSSCSSFSFSSPSPSSSLSLSQNLWKQLFLSHRHTLGLTHHNLFIIWNHCVHLLVRC